MHRTALYERHRSLGAKVVEFAGWEMPVQYRSIVSEHQAVREKAGLFDLQHMGRLRITGPGRVAFLEKLVTQAVATAKPGMARYALVLDERGCAQDDVIFYVLPEALLVVVNASNRERIVAHMEHHLVDGVRLEDLTFRLGMIAVQGPQAAAIVSRLADRNLDEIKYYRCAGAMVLGEPCLLARTGYTGEDGFELVFDAEDAPRFWDALLDHGSSAGLVPAGLGARDTLRLEAGMALYGHELDLDTNPLEAGLDFAVKLEKEFIGRDALRAALASGLKKRLVGFEAEGKRIPRQGHPVFANQAAPFALQQTEEVGKVTSGTHSPTLGKNICLAYVPARLAEKDAQVSFEVGIGDARYPLRRVEVPFYSRKK